MGNDFLKVGAGLDLLIDGVVPGEVLGFGVFHHVAAAADEPGQRDYLVDVLEVVPGIEFFVAFRRDVQPDRDETLSFSHR